MSDVVKTINIRLYTHLSQTFNFLNIIQVFLDIFQDVRVCDGTSSAIMGN